MVEFSSEVLRVFIMTINNKSERNYRGKCLGWPVTSYGAGKNSFLSLEIPKEIKGSLSSSWMNG